MSYTPNLSAEGFIDPRLLGTQKENLAPEAMDIDRAPDQVPLDDAQQDSQLHPTITNGQDVDMLDIGISGKENELPREKKDSVVAEHANQAPSPTDYATSAPLVHPQGLPPVQTQGILPDAFDYSSQPDVVYEKPHSVVDLSQAKMHEVPDILRIYNIYRNGFSHAGVTGESKMNRALVLAETLLEHYFPASQDFAVERVIKFPNVNPGWSIELAGDTIWGTPNCRFVDWENITGFRVNLKYDMTDGKGHHWPQYFPHMHLAILNDDLHDYDQWRKHPEAPPPPAPTKSKSKKKQMGPPGPPAIPLPTNNLGDIMTREISKVAKILKGYGIVIAGPRIEFYKYAPVKVGNHWKSFMQPLHENDWSFDMRTTPPAKVDQVFEEVATSHVYYLNDIVAKGSSIRDRYLDQNISETGNTYV